MAHKRSRLIQHITYAACLAFFKIFSWTPLPVAHAVGAGLARAAYHLVPRIKTIGMANLDIAYGDSLSRQEKERILRGSVKNLGLVAVEFTRVPTLLEQVPNMNISVKGLEHVDKTRGGVIFSGHLGNWEWMLPVGAHLGIRGIVIARAFDDPRMNAFVDKTRRASGLKIVLKDAAMEPLLRKIPEGYYAGLLADQSPRDNAVPVTFFGEPTWATIGPALIAMRSNTPIYPVSMTRDDHGDYTIEFYPALELADTGNTLADLQSNTQLCQDALETMIRKHPEQWLWFHKRWKKRPRLEREWAERVARKKADNNERIGTQTLEQE